jgi:dipeptidyl aminopeptidase/acylaminoacyl peptidase
MSRAIAAICLSMTFALPLSAQHRAMTADDMALEKGVSDPRVSPDGRTVAYVRTSTEYATNAITNEIVVIDLGTGKPTQAFAGTSPRWSPDGSAIAYSTPSGIAVFEIASGRSHDVAPVSQTDNWTGSGTIKNFAWSPDGSSIAFVGAEAATPAPANDVRAYSRIMYKTRTGFSDDRRTHIWVVSAHGGEPRLLTPGNHDEHSLSWSPDSKRIAFVSDRSADPDNVYHNDLWTIDVASGAIARVTDTPGAEFAPVWSPDGTQLAYPAWTRPHNTKDSPAEDTHAWVISASGGTPHQVAVPLDRRVSEVSWQPGAATVYFVAADHGSSAIFRAPASGAAAQRLITCQCQVRQYSFDRMGKQMVYVRTDVTHPPEVWISAADGSGAHQLTHDQDALLSQVTMADAEAFEVPSFDGTHVQGWIMKPVGLREGQRYPLILSIHGGPHGMFGYTFSDRFQMMVGRGYGVVFLNPRGSSGYGQAFSDGTVLNWGGGDYKDLMIGLDSAIRRNASWIDTTRLGITGGSYGGFMTNWVITQTPRFKAAVSVASVSNLISFYGTSLYTDLIEAEFNMMPWDNYPLLWQWSPLAHVEHVTTPTLFLHGEVDHDVPITQAEEMYVALGKLGVPTTIARYPNEGHGFRQPTHIMDSIKRTDAWFDQYLHPKSVQ